MSGLLLQESPSFVQFLIYPLHLFGFSTYKVAEREEEERTGRGERARERERRKNAVYL